MPLVRARRTAATTKVTRNHALLAKRLVSGTAFMAASAGIGVGLGGFFWALSAIVAIPGVFTLVSARRPFTAPCPACATLLGDGLLHLPDEPVMGQDATDIRCYACGIYVDCMAATVRELPFNRTLDGPGYEMSFPNDVFAAVTWGSRCVRCGDPATRGLRLARFDVGVLSGFEATLDGPADGTCVPYCARHGEANDPASRGIVVARSSGRVDVQLSLYAVYREILDANRERADVTVRAMEEPETP